MEYCREAGYQVGVSVVDRSGVTQVFVRDRFAGMHVKETAFRKAWTSVSFKGATIELDGATRPDFGRLRYSLYFRRLATGRRSPY